MTLFFALGWFAFGVVCAAGIALMLWLARPDSALDDEPTPPARVGSGYNPAAWCVACHAPYRIEAERCPECGLEVKA